MAREMLSGEAIAWGSNTLPISQFLWQYTHTWAQALNGFRIAIIGYRLVIRSTGEVCPSFMKSRWAAPRDLDSSTPLT